MQPLTLAQICDTLLNGARQQQLRDALDEFARLCAEVSGIAPDPGFDAWSGDIFLNQGVAINPRAAAHCVRDYRRSVVFLRAVDAAIHTAIAACPELPVRILYAGCGPFATLLLPLLERFKPAQLEVHLLDVHQHSLDSVCQLLSHFKLGAYNIHTVCADACTYQHPRSLHLILAETMQKSLEQEPQVAVTANLAPQLCRDGLFIPEKIEVELCLARLDAEREIVRGGKGIDGHALEASGLRIPLGVALTLVPARAASQVREATPAGNCSRPALGRTRITIPAVQNLESFDALFFTRIQVFAGFGLRDYEAEITLPSRCQELAPLRAGAEYQLCYQLGNYPRFDLLGLN